MIFEKETKDSAGETTQDDTRGHEHERVLWGVTLRDKFAMAAPITYEQAIKAYGHEPVLDEWGRVPFYAFWALLHYEYADAMMAERVRPAPTPQDLCEHDWVTLSTRPSDTYGGVVETQECSKCGSSGSLVRKLSWQERWGQWRKNREDRPDA